MRESKRPRLVVFKLILWSIASFFVLGAIGDGGYPLPVFESSPLTKIPVVSGSKITPPAARKARGSDPVLTRGKTDPDQDSPGGTAVPGS